MGTFVPSGLLVRNAEESTGMLVRTQVTLTMLEGATVLLISASK